jgi:hypothetical protein
MVQRQRTAKTISDAEFSAAMERILLQDKALLEKLAKV